MPRLKPHFSLLASSMALSKFVGVFVFCCCLDEILGTEFYHVA